MKRRTSLKLALVASTFYLGLVMATLSNRSPLAARPAQSQVVAFQDTYSRDDTAPPEDSLGTTEAGPGLVALDYRELGGCCGSPSVRDIAQIENGKLVIRGSGTDPAWVELDGAGTDLVLEVEAEFLATDVEASAAANSVGFLMRNSGTGSDGTIFTSGSVAFNMRLDGRFGVRAFLSGMDDNIKLVDDTIDASSFAAADLDADGRLERGEPFTLRLVLQGKTLSFSFDGSSQVSDLHLSGVPDPGTDADRLLFGRNRWQFTSVGVDIRFDNLRSLRALPGTPTATSTATATATPMYTGQWQAMSLDGAPVGRYGHTAIWSGDEMIIWGGYFHLNNFLNDGAGYDPVTDAWTPMSTVNAPIGRLRHTAVWTGDEMIVWGGESSGGGRTTNAGGRYDPVTDTWRSISMENAPSRREMHSALWTGTEMIVWGGCPTIFCKQVFNDGGRYDPATDTWTPIPAVEGLTPRHRHQAVWTGDRMIVWGGSDDPQGMAYDPTTNTWTPISTDNSPRPTYHAASVWTGGEMIVWGGCTVSTPQNPCLSSGETPYTNSGGRYNPATDTWTPITATGAPAARWTHTAIWTGQEMIVWGGCGNGCYDTGGRYNPRTDTWIGLELINAPSPRSNHEAVWTGEAMVVWGGCFREDRGGCGDATYFNTGGQYLLNPTPAPTATVTPTATSERSTGPHLDIPSDIPATADQPVSIPINFSSNGHDIASITFSIDYDQTCLSFDPTDGDGDDIPDAIVFGVPEAFGTTVTFDESDPDGELDFFIADTFPPLASLPDGTIATMSLTPTCQASPNAATIATVNFATDPRASFGNTEGHSVPGSTSNGSVLIQPGLPGDCNADHAVDAGDIPALALEVFDGDGANPADTQGGTFAGDPVGCNANQDALVDAGDITCLALLIFNGPGACGSGDRECVAPPSGLVGWWPGDSDANDISGNNNHAQLANGALAGTPGKVGGAFEFDGVDDVADTDLTLPAQGTLELWVNPTSLSHDHGIMGTFGKANGDDRLWLKVTGPEGGIGGPNRLRVNLGSCCVADIDISSPLALETWTHLALTFDYILDDYVVYVNGQVAGTTTVSRDAPTGKLSFGGLNSTWGESLFFSGLVDEVTLYDRVLTANEIEAIFNAGSAGKCKDDTHSLTSPGSSRALPGSNARRDGPMLVIPDLMSPSAGRHVSVPVDFASNGHSIASIAFSVDYDENLLVFDPTDDNQDDLPDTITLNLPSAFDASVNFDESDSAGELDFLIADTLPPLASLPDGTVAAVSLNAVRSPTSTTSAKISFSDNPVASFGNTSGQSVPGTTHDGSVLIRCPDCVLFLPMMLTSGANER